MAGVLYIVATPIGNLEDLSIRAQRILQTVAVVACEDTRQSSKLMAAANAHRPLVSLHEHNEAQRCHELVSRLAAGDDVALISDAGTPLVSDPGYRLVEAAIEANIRVSPIPGASAVLSALSIAGLPTDQFAFIGFLPHKQVARRKLLEAWASADATLVCFESPHRILEALEDLQALWPQRRMAACRELTKLHEEVLRGKPGEILDSLKQRPAIKGEFTLVIDRAGRAEASSPDQLKEIVLGLIASGVSRMDAIKQAAKEVGLTKREAYEHLEKEKS
ncbi:MAG: 16S rRNA (cytidine(1402)-2'-O)-methyltransferase [Acidobacteria bacterium]|nr:16S rRNA (cytidine(1402)-2'-O)-methyltransferase [Acidobacteriota bacterium]